MRKNPHSLIYEPNDARDCHTSAPIGELEACTWPCPVYLRLKWEKATEITRPCWPHQVIFNAGGTLQFMNLTSMKESHFYAGFLLEPNFKMVHLHIHSMISGWGYGDNIRNFEPLWTLHYDYGIEIQSSFTYTNTLHFSILISVINKTCLQTHKRNEGSYDFDTRTILSMPRPWDIYISVLAIWRCILIECLMALQHLKDLFHRHVKT